MRYQLRADKLPIRRKSKSPLWVKGTPFKVRVYAWLWSLWYIHTAPGAAIRRNEEKQGKDARWLRRNTWYNLYLFIEHPWDDT